MISELPDPARSRAVLIGVGSYRNLAALPAVANNIATLADVLVDRDVWGLPPSHCHIIEDPETIDAVLGPIHKAAEAAQAALLVYFAGHGLLDQNGELYLGLPDSTADRLHRAVRYPEIRRELATTAGRCPAKVVILDCCFSGAAAGTLMSAGGQLAQRAAIEGAYLMTATAATALALAPKGAKHTAFTGAILDTVRAGIPQAPPVLDMATLFADVETTLRERDQPIPQSFGRDAGHRIAIVRNRQHVADATPTPATSTRSSPGADGALPKRRFRRLQLAAWALVICLIAGTAVAAYLGPFRERGAQTSPGPPGASAPITSALPSPSTVGSSPVTPTAGSRRPTQTAGPPGTANPALGGTAPTGVITSPADGADVQSCAYFAGTATLPAGKTLILAKRNLTNGLPDRYVELVFRWDHPQTSWAWRGAQYFSTGNDADGQQFLIELMSVDLAAARAARTSGEGNDLAAIGFVLASRKVNRIAGTAPQDPCEGP